MTQYTITFGPEQEHRFNDALSRLDPEEYTIVEPVTLVKPDDPRYSDRTTVMDMEPEACLTFRLGMNGVKIRRARTEEELAEEKALNDKNTIKITIQVPPENMPPTV